jgi:hypothetical protein
MIKTYRFAATKHVHHAKPSVDRSQLVAMCTHPLELVIDRAAQILVRVLDDGHHKISSLTFTKPEREAVTQSANCGFALEAGEARAQHELHGRDQLGSVWAQSEESGDAELLEEGVTLRVAPAHQDDHFVIQLE